MELNAILSRGGEYIFSEIDGEVVMMNLNTGAYASVNDTGKSIWNLLAEPVSLSLVLDSLVKEYSISREQCEKDVMPFIEKMLKQKIIVAA